MLSQYQQSAQRQLRDDELQNNQTQLIKMAQMKILLLLKITLCLIGFTTITTLITIIEPELVGIEICKLCSHILALILYLAIHFDLKNANSEILSVPKQKLRLLTLTYEKSLYDFLEEFKFQEKFDLLNVLLYSSIVWSFWFSQFIWILHPQNIGLKVILYISYFLHMGLYCSACIYSCFRQNPQQCECSILKTKDGYHYINLPRLKQTKSNTIIFTITLLIYYTIKTLIETFFIFSSNKETQLVLYMNISYLSTMIIKQFYLLRLINKIQKVNQRYLICFQNTYLLYYKLFFYSSSINCILNFILIISSLGCIGLNAYFYLINYFKYIEHSIYQIEVYLFNDTTCFLLSIIIYCYYLLKKYQIKVNIDNLEQLNEFDSRFYNIDNQIIMNPYYQTLNHYLQIEDQEIEQRNQREIIRKLQISPEKSFIIEGECIICTEKMETESQLIGLQCHPSHVFHKDCLIKWVLLHTTCPTCRSPIQ